MPRNKENIIVFDMETTGLDHVNNDCIEICAQVIDPMTLEKIPADDGGCFYSLMKPDKPENIEEKALAVNKKTREEILAAPEAKLVWPQFANWVAGWKRVYAPIAAGKNIRGFDLLFVEELNKRHLKTKKGSIFSRRTIIDLEDFLFYWFEGNEELFDYKMDTVRPYFGLSAEGAHSATIDVEQTADLIIHFMKLHRQMFKKVKNLRDLTASK
jgi:DNA polymerase III epsilon subunit-like protein